MKKNYHPKKYIFLKKYKNRVYKLKSFINLNKLIKKND